MKSRGRFVVRRRHRNVFRFHRNNALRYGNTVAGRVAYRIYLFPHGNAACCRFRRRRRFRFLRRSKVIAVNFQYGNVVRHRSAHILGFQRRTGSVGIPRSVLRLRKNVG